MLRSISGNLDLAEITRFGIIGVAATATHFCVLSGAVEILGISAMLSNGIAFLVAVSVTYLGQALWVFRRHSRHGRRQVLKFTVSLAIGFIVNVAVMSFVKDGLNFDYRVGFVASLVTVPVLSFGINKLWVFRSGPV